MDRSPVRGLRGSGSPRPRDTGVGVEGHTRFGVWVAPSEDQGRRRGRVGGSGCGAAPEAQLEPGVALWRTEPERCKEMGRGAQGGRTEAGDREAAGTALRCQEPRPQVGCTLPATRLQMLCPSFPHSLLWPREVLASRMCPSGDVRSSCLLKRGWFPFCPRPSPAQPGEATLTRERPPSWDWQRRARQRERGQVCTGPASVAPGQPGDTALVGLLLGLTLGARAERAAFCYSPILHTTEFLFHRE